MELPFHENDIAKLFIYSVWLRKSATRNHPVRWIDYMVCILEVTIF